MRLLHSLGIVSLLIYVAVAAMSTRFAVDVPSEQRPILEVVALLAVATVVWLAALASLLRRNPENDGPACRVILLYAVLFRLALLPSLPIQEIDFYRYLWDGRSLAHGFNPYRYSPQQIEMLSQQDDAPADVRALKRLSQESAPVQTIFERVHQRPVPTVYPPAAQVIFASAALITPATAPLWLHIVVLKTILLGFDLGTLRLLAALLGLVQRPRALCLAYGWCPLVLKEIANSAHLDSVAVFFTVLAVYLLVRAATMRPRPCLTLASAALAALGLGVLAKSYPLLLVFVGAGFLFAHWGTRGLVPLAAFFLVIIVGYTPFRTGARAPEPSDETGLVDRQEHHPGSGLQTFLTRWQVNDLLFMIVEENLRWPMVRADPWFVVVPRSWRQKLHEEVLETWTERLPSGADPAFVLTQALLGLVLGLLCLRWAWLIYGDGGQIDTLLRGVFLTLIVGWLFSSAQNPWYLVWSLPFMIFARQRAWFLLPGLVLLYYVRFWLEYHAPATDAGPSEALAFFDYGLVWLEYLPLYVALFVESLLMRFRRARASRLFHPIDRHPGAQGHG